MKPEAQRIAIAGVLGYTNLRHCTCSGDKTSGEKDGERITHIPDFTRDLNAMHEAEQILTPQQGWEYAQNLVVDGGKGWFATAAQRAEAFLRTIGKWTETNP